MAQQVVDLVEEWRARPLRSPAASAAVVFVDSDDELRNLVQPGEPGIVDHQLQQVRLSS